MNDTLLNSDDEAIMLEQVNQTVVESTDNEVLSNDVGTFSDLQNEIDLASKVQLLLWIRIMPMMKVFLKEELKSIRI